MFSVLGFSYFLAMMHLWFEFLIKSLKELQQKPADLWSHLTFREDQQDPRCSTHLVVSAQVPSDF